MNPPTLIEMLDSTDLSDLVPLAAVWDFWSLDSLQESARNLPLKFYVARLEAVLVAVSIWTMAEDTADLLYLFSDPKMRGQGIASRLMEVSHTELEKQGINTCLLEVKENNFQAIELYNKLGYQMDRRIPKYYKDGIDALFFIKTFNT